MTRRNRRGLTRLAIAIGAPIFCLWLYHQAMVANFAAAARNDFGKDMGPAELAMTLEMLAQQETVSLVQEGALLWLIGGYFLLRWVSHGFRPIGRLAQLRTRRLLLRRFRPEDLEPLHAVMSDPQAMAQWSTPPHASLDETRVWLNELLALPEESSDDFAVVRGGRVIGMLGSREWPNVGFALARSEWRKGYGIEALNAFSGYAFDRGQDFLIAGTYPANAACIALLRKAGFDLFYKGTAEHMGETRDILGFALYAPAIRERARERLLAGSDVPVPEH